MDTATDHGWDKSARLLAERRRRIRERVPDQLEPPFPWRAVPFDPEFFRIPADPSAGAIDSGGD